MRRFLSFSRLSSKLLIGILSAALLLISSPIAMSNTILSQSGQTIVLAPGETLTLQLKENPTTGYRWQLPNLEAQPIELIEDQFELPQPSTSASKAPAIGAGGKRILTLKAISKGTVHLALQNRQAWDAAMPAAESFTVNIEVKP